jgi:molecular chaperone DnaK
MKLLLNPNHPSLPPVPTAIKGRCIGIDLGTTNSTVAEAVPTEGTGSFPRLPCLPVRQATELTEFTSVLVPSVVALFNGREFVGEGAKWLRCQMSSKDLKQNRQIFWECKNDMGLRRTYHLAPAGYQSATEISARILSFLANQASAASTGPIARTVITVPASFQVAQRTDTLKAAELAGIPLSRGDLLDEPIAAFLDYLATHPEKLSALNAGAKLLVFDFGGGTCDVAIFQLQPRDSGLDISAAAVSRFHRLGGGDIDRAIVHKVLIPQFCAENNLGAHDLDYEAKRLCLEPALQGVAETLKLQLCQKIAELQLFDRWNPAAAKTTVAETGMIPAIPLNGHSHSFSNPRLDAAAFSEVLAPFIDQDLLYPRETEYGITQSIFSPLSDSLARARVDRSEISLVLMVGGSSLIPQIREAVTSFFHRAKILDYQDSDSVQMAVARGAAFHAYLRSCYGTSIFRQVAYDRIGIRTASGVHELVAKGAPLDGADLGKWQVCNELAIPNTNLTKETVLCLELVAGDEERDLHSQLWHIQPPTTAGERLRLEYRFTENQVFEFRLTLLERPDESLNGELQNPLTHVVNPQVARQEIETAEEQLRAGQIPERQKPDTVLSLGRKYHDIGQTEKAIAMLKKSLQMRGRPHVETLNLLGIYSGNICDYKRQELYYREAADADPNWTGPLLNLAIAFKDRKEYQRALETLDELEQRSACGPSLTLRVLVLDQLKKTGSRDGVLNRALSLFDPLSEQDDWELHWYGVAASLNKDSGLQQKIQAEKKRRDKGSQTERSKGELPMIAPTLGFPR